MISDDTFFLSQLDNSCDKSNAHLASAMQGFLQGWYHNANEAVVVDKNRAWLHAMNCYCISSQKPSWLFVCVRELGQIYGSIEAQHQKTILLDFIDH